MKIRVRNEEDIRNWLKNISPAIFQNVDLTAYTSKLNSKQLYGCSFLGCPMEIELLKIAAEAGCLILPPIPSELANEIPFEPYTIALYTPSELYAGFNPNRPETIDNYKDRKIYLTFKDKNGAEIEVDDDVKLIRRMHDATINDALNNLIAPFKTKIVAIMGGHDISRAHASYANTAYLALDLANEGYTIATGGGPGLMEAANLGAYAAGFSNPRNLIADVIEKIKNHNAVNNDYTEWMKAGYSAWSEMGSPEFPTKSMNIGIPTWFYGHEPPNLFATDVAKYFENSIREEGLLAIAQGGIVFMQGNAGTVQEIFQDACQNYYGNYDKLRSPMVLFESEYWNPPSMDLTDRKNKRKQVFPLLHKLAFEKGFEDYVAIADSNSDVIAFIKSHPPKLL